MNLMSRPFNAKQWGVGADDQRPPPDPSGENLSCTIIGTSPRFISQDQSFAIWSALIEAPGEKDGRQVVIKGPLARISSGEMLACEGRWREHKQHGWSFEVRAYQSALPISDKGVAVWLETKVDGIGPTFAKAVVDHFGSENVFDILDDNPERLREVVTGAGRSLPEKQVVKAIAAWDDVRAIRQIETFLFSYGITANLADRLYRFYGTDVVDILRDDPYRVTQMRGVGFRIADKIALAMGVSLDDPARIRAAIVYALEQSEDGGHVFLLLQQMIGHTVEVLTPIGSTDPPQIVRDPRKIVAQAGLLAEQGKIIVEKDQASGQRIYSKHIYEIECSLARRIRSMIEEKPEPLFPRPTRPTAPEGHEDVASLHLPSDQQWEVIEDVRGQLLTLLNGGPGTGKTATVNTLVKMAEEHDLDVALCAPTGKAARRMREMSGHEASTIHRLLEFSPFDGGFQRDENNPIEADLVVVDEASMLSLDLADDLFRAIGSQTHVLLVGDPDQLPPVGVGKVLDDLIKTEAVPRVHLTEIFRQAARSMIIQNSRRINRGEVPFAKKEEAENQLGLKMLNDFYWVKKSDAASAAELTLDFVCNRIPRVFDLDPVRDIMVLAPMRKGACGLEVLNRELEARLNPEPKQMVLAKRGIYVGSRIVQSKNDYTTDREVMNGEIAVVVGFDGKEATLSLDDGERQIVLPPTDMETYHLAWALSIHKSQGSEFPCVVVPISWSHYTMLTRALAYTAVTRASKLCIVIDDRSSSGGRALKAAVGRADMAKRNSTLVPRILRPGLSGELF